MPTNNKPNNHTSFSRDLGLFDASMIGIGAMIGAGIFVLTGLAAGEPGQPPCWLSPSMASLRC